MTYPVKVDTAHMKFSLGEADLWLVVHTHPPENVRMPKYFFRE